MFSADVSRTLANVPERGRHAGAYFSEGEIPERVSGKESVGEREETMTGFAGTEKRMGTKIPTSAVKNRKGRNGHIIHGRSGRKDPSMI